MNLILQIRRVNMNLTEHAVMEIGYLHLEDKEKEEYLKKFVTEFMHEFSEQGHSNHSAPFAIAWFKKHTECKTFVDKELKDVIDYPVELKDDDPDTWMNNDVYDLVKKYHELVNTEEFIVHDIDESWIQNILYRLMDWKPITPLMGTPDEWYDDNYPIIREGNNIHYQNKRYSSIFALDKNGKDAYNINGKVFTRNGVSFTNGDSRVPVSFPYSFSSFPSALRRTIIRPSPTWPDSSVCQYHIRFLLQHNKPAAEAARFPPRRKTARPPPE